MTDLRTPTTEQVRDAYADRKDFESQVSTGLHASGVKSFAQFHRWLDNVKAEAWQEGYDSGVNAWDPYNPYKVQIVPFCKGKDD